MNGKLLTFFCCDYCEVFELNNAEQSRKGREEGNNKEFSYQLEKVSVKMKLFRHTLHQKGNK